MGQGDMDPHVGEGSIIGIEAIGTFSLTLPSGMTLELRRCYYIPRLNKNGVSYDLLIDSGFRYVSCDKSILCYQKKNNILELLQ